MIDLHLHLDGSVAPQDIIKAAEESGIECGCKNVDEIRKKWFIALMSVLL